MKCEMWGQSFDFAGGDSAKTCGKDFRGLPGAEVDHNFPRQGYCGEERGRGAESLNERNRMERAESEKMLGGGCGRRDASK